jgi:hypothetical protein
MIKSHNRSFLLRELQALACQVTGEEVSLIEGDAGACWSWNWRDRVITVDPDYLTEKSADVCRAILLHESAHCAITRIHHLYPIERCQLYQDLLNVLEDLRIESWLASKFPGCAVWIHTANELIFQSLVGSSWSPNYQVQFLRAILEKAHSGQIRRRRRTSGARGAGGDGQCSLYPDALPSRHRTGTRGCEGNLERPATHAVDFR